MHPSRNHSECYTEHWKQGCMGLAPECRGACGRWIQPWNLSSERRGDRYVPISKRWETGPQDQIQRGMRFVLRSQPEGTRAVLHCHAPEKFTTRNEYYRTLKWGVARQVSAVSSSPGQVSRTEPEVSPTSFDCECIPCIQLFEQHCVRRTYLSACSARRAFVTSVILSSLILEVQVDTSLA